ncbi:LuxR C-terminal-related transcriptional regulator [Zobellella sp. An-6]|uniref:LuxR C-terminal-related transcriptional regulator n=1 Tax=Zobellella sp. An-6 TaxID=3400218 RepID=UPI0040428414
MFRLDSSLAVAGEISSVERKGSALVRTKTRVPRNCGDVLRRGRLEELGHKIRQRLLTLVTAPPGCGKTTLACQWADQFVGEGVGVAWFSLDTEDNDPLRFLLYLHQALTDAGFGPSATRGTNVTRAADFPTVDDARSALINRIDEVGDDLVMVLDNYSWITNARIHGEMSYILDNAPCNLHLIILSSAPPPLQIGRLRAQNRLLELNSGAIRFNRSETLTLLQQAAGPLVPSAQLHELYRVTQGWAAAVRIAALTIQNRDQALFRETLDGRILDDVDEYLDDLFLPVPDDVMAMMIDTALVDTLSLPLCRALTERDETEMLFCQLKQQQLLLSLDPDRGTFAYPELVRRYLHHKLVGKSQHHLSRLHRRAQSWYAQRGQWERAVDHALAAGDRELALRWMEPHAMSILKAGNSATVIRWHHETGPLSAAIYQRIQLAFAWAYALSHSQETAFELLAMIEAPPAALGPLSPAVQAECAAIRAASHALADQVERACEYSTRCSGYRFLDGWIGSVVANVELYCQFRTGRWTAFFSEPTVLNTHAEEEINSHILRLSILGLAGLLRGQLELAEQYCVDAIRLSPPERDKDIQRFSAWPAGLLASIYYEAGRLDELEALLSDRLKEIAANGYLDCTMEAFLCAARAAAWRGEPAEAFRLLEQAEAVAIQRKWDRFEAAILLERMRLLLDGDRLDEARGCLQRLTQVPLGEVAAEHASPVCGPRQAIAIARACLAIHSGHAEAAIGPLQTLSTQFSRNGNELAGVRLGTLLSIAYRRSGHDEAAKRTFRETIEKAARGGFVSAVIDQGAEAGQLLSELWTRLRQGEENKGLREHCERLLCDARLYVGRSTASFEKTDTRDGTGCTLTPKEHEVLTLIACGQSNKEIARNLGVTPETIKTHLKNIFCKLSVDRRIKAVARGRELGLLARESV